MFMFLGCGRKPSLQGELPHFLVTGPLGQPSSAISSCLSNCWSHYFKDRHLLNLVNYHTDDSNRNFCLGFAEERTGLVPGSLSGWFWTVWFIYQQVKSVSVLFCVGFRQQSVEDVEENRLHSSAWCCRAGVVAPPGEVLLQRHHLPPALLRRRPLLSLQAQMLRNLQLQIIALLDQCCCRETREQLIPLGIIPAKVCRNASSGQTSVQIIHKTLTFHPLWVALVGGGGFRGLTPHRCRICSSCEFCVRCRWPTGTTIE